MNDHEACERGGERAPNDRGTCARGGDHAETDREDVGGSRTTPGEVNEP